MLSLAYYANQLGLFFSQESIVVHSIDFLYNYQKQNSNNLEIQISKIVEVSLLIQEIFNNEFILLEEP